MFTKLPKWVEYGAFTLSLIAGLINAVGVLGFEHKAISHLSGSVTLLGVSLSSNIPMALNLLMIIMSFIIGSAISGLLISGESLKLGRYYDVLLFIESGLLLMAALLLNRYMTVGLCFASMACGLQNAFATTYSGAVIRTTHLTGIFTDLGIMFGRAIKGEALDKRKCVMFIVIIFGFLSGGVLGSVLFGFYGVFALLFPALACFILGCLYRVYRQLSQN